MYVFPQWPIWSFDIIMYSVFKSEQRFLGNDDNLTIENNNNILRDPFSL